MSHSPSLRQQQQQQQQQQHLQQQLQQRDREQHDGQYSQQPFYRVVVPHRARCDGEISLNIDDVITSVKQLGNGWTLGRNRSSITGDQAGIFPSRCVQLLCLVDAVEEESSSLSDPYQRIRSDVDEVIIGEGRAGQMTTLDIIPCESCDQCCPTYALTSGQKLDDLLIIQNETKPRMIVKPHQDKTSPQPLTSEPNYHDRTPSHHAGHQGQTPQSRGSYQDQMPSPRNSHQDNSPPNRASSNKQHSLDVRDNNTHERDSENTLLLQRRQTISSKQSTSTTSNNERNNSANDSYQRRKVLLSFDGSWQTATSSILPIESPSPRLRDYPTPTAIYSSISDHRVERRSSRTTTPDREEQRELALKSCASPESRRVCPFRREYHPWSVCSEGSVGGGEGDGDVEMLSTSGKERCLTAFTPPSATSSSSTTLPTRRSDQSTGVGHRSSARVHPRRRSESATDIHVRLRGAGDCSRSSFTTTTGSLAPSSRSGAGRCVRVLQLILSSLFVGFVTFMTARFYLDYDVRVSAALGGAVVGILCVVLPLSRVCRCVLALLLPSFCTGRGRIAYVALLTGSLLAGPVTNVYFNTQQIARSMSCSAERSYNQTMLLLEPFDAMMIRVNETIAGLQEAARDVWKGLAPLHDQLGDVESDVYNGQLQLYGTGKTCRNLIERAHNACAAGIRGARDQCLGVIGALGSVYHHARDILDTINPDRWAPKQHQLLQQKRQTLSADGTRMIDGITLPADDTDICEPLSSLTVCHSLNDSSALCQPSTWAGDAIQDAINSTRSAMADLRRALRFRVTSEPYEDARINASAVVFRIRQGVLAEFEHRTDQFMTIVDVLRKLVPAAAALLLIHSAYTHVKLFACVDAYDNMYLTGRFRTLDNKRQAAGVGGGGGAWGVAGSLIPLRPYERRYIADTSEWKLSAAERRITRSGLCVFALHLMTTTCCFAFDAVLYWVLALVDRHGRPGFDVTDHTDEELGLVITGDGLIVELLDIFLKAFHPDHWFGYSSTVHLCLPEPKAPHVLTIVTVLLFHLTFFLLIIWKAYVFRIRNEIVCYFYAERESERTLQLYGIVLMQRLHLRTRMHKLARANHRMMSIRQENSLTCRLPLPALRLLRRIWQGTWLERCCRKCLVCRTRESGEVKKQFYECPTRDCGSLYCKECIKDLGEICSICSPSEMLGNGTAAGSNSCDDVDDCLLLYSLESIRNRDV